MEMLDSIHELSNVFDGIRLHHPVTMNFIIFPFSDVLNSVFIFLVVDLEIIELTCMQLWDRLVAILGESQ